MPTPDLQKLFGSERSLCLSKGHLTFNFPEQTSTITYKKKTNILRMSSGYHRGFPWQIPLPTPAPIQVGHYGERWWQKQQVVGPCSLTSLDAGARSQEEKVAQAELGQNTVSPFAFCPNPGLLPTLPQPPTALTPGSALSSHPPLHPQGRGPALGSPHPSCPQLLSTQSPLAVSKKTGRPKSFTHLHMGSQHSPWGPQLVAPVYSLYHSHFWNANCPLL